MRWSAMAQIVLAMASVASLGGCREDERNRPLAFEAGKYQGPADEKLDDRLRKELEQRGNLMR